MALIISEPQTRKLVDMAQAVALLDKMFRDRAAGKMRSVPRRRLKGSEKQLNMMAAWHQDSDLIWLRSCAADANTITLYHGQGRHPGDRQYGFFEQPAHRRRNRSRRQISSAGKQQSPGRDRSGLASDFSS